MKENFPFCQYILLFLEQLVIALFSLSYTVPVPDAHQIEMKLEIR